MNIILPKKNSQDEKITLVSPGTVVIIGANGSGKSRFGREIENYPGVIAYRMSAAGALSVEADHIDESGASISERFRNMTNHLQSLGVQRGWLQGAERGMMLSDFDKVIFLLLREEFESATEFKQRFVEDNSVRPEQTRLDKVQALWEKIFPGSKLLKVQGSLQAFNGGGESVYNTDRMSRGEKVVLYLIAASLYAKPKSLILVEEPELHLHPSILKLLWDEIELLRKDCTFVYLTYDISFTTSRYGLRVWVKSYDADHHTWDYDLLSDHTDLPEAIYLDILGSRKPVLFVEGTDNTSIDFKLYPLVFQEYQVKPLGGCNRVIDNTKALSDMKEFHFLQPKGIVDRDRRTEKEIQYLRSKNIFVPNVAEVENLMMLETVIRVVSRRMLQNENVVFNQVKQKLIELFSHDIESQALLHTRHRLRRRLEMMIDRRLNTIEELSHHIDTLTDDVNTVDLYNHICERFKTYVNNYDYNSILKVYNQKSMIGQSQVAQLCGINGKEKYLDFILSILKEDKEDAGMIRESIRECFGL